MKLILITLLFLPGFITNYLFQYSLLSERNNFASQTTGDNVSITMTSKIFPNRYNTRSAYSFRILPTLTSSVFSPPRGVLQPSLPNVENCLSGGLTLVCFNCLSTFSAKVCTSINDQYNCSWTKLLMVCFNPPKHLAIVFSGSIRSHFNMNARTPP